DALYRASAAGVPVDIVVRGVCALVPSREGLSDTIRVRSVLGRYLEHSRVFSFQNGGDPQVYIGSADMMHRNLDRRIEALIRLTDPGHLTEIDDLFETTMSDRTASWHLRPEGDWQRVHRDERGRLLADLQNVVMNVIATRRRGGAARA
ncbi:MAG: RNA degradosome polyphosphate kinase, partial [Microbacteriaceae bacterium]|nr:RNA degradosome polyphosphate kinase [Microbacteriaceae bacterium]